MCVDAVRGELLGTAGGGFGGDVGDDHDGAGHPEFPADGQAQSARSTGDHGHLTMERLC